MLGLNHLFDNALVGLALLSVLVIFVVSIIVAIAACFRPAWAPGNQNFTYVATAIAGLVLSVSSGVLGKPVELSSAPVSNPSSTVAGSVQASLSNNQIAEFQQLYAWTYVVSGLVALLVFITTTAHHDLVKSVALTTLGFLITLVGALTSQVPAAVATAQQKLIEVIPKTSLLLH